MNIYLITEDGETFCIKAETMAQAIEVCEASYLDDRREEAKAFPASYNENTERAYYHNEILQSCSLVGELKN